MRPWNAFWPALLAVLCATAPAAGASWTLSGGVFNFNKTPTALEAGVELRHPLRVWGLDGAAGVSASENSSVWAHVGVRREVGIGGRWRLAPGFGVAFYSRGDGKDLGSSSHFRSSLELSRELPSGHRLGVAVYHLSNAGLDELNPGSNSAIVTYTVPFGE